MSKKAKQYSATEKNKDCDRGDKIRNDNSSN